MYMLPEIERRKMGFNGRKLAESTYSRNRINNEFMKLVKNIIKENV